MLNNLPGNPRYVVSRITTYFNYEPFADDFAAVCHYAWTAGVDCKIWELKGNEYDCIMMIDMNGQIYPYAGFNGTVWTAETFGGRGRSGFCINSSPTYFVNSEVVDNANKENPTDNPQAPEPGSNPDPSGAG